MLKSSQEIEVKFYVNSLPALQAKLERAGAVLTQPRVLERNLRFDTQAGDLRRTYRALRLRQDANIHLTFKGPGQIQQGALTRTEIEFTVGDFDAARAFLEALGYHVWVVYEKYRATYALGETLVTLDELPYGTFAEIEGPTPQTIAAVTHGLELDWEARINTSYLALFDRLRQALDFPFHDLTFDNFANITISAAQLKVRPAD